MTISRPLRGGLFVFESAKLLFLLAFFVALQPGDGSFPWLVYAAPNALFPLMALFLWLDFSRYWLYLPLHLAGKCINIVSVVIWLIISRPMAWIEFIPGGNPAAMVPLYMVLILLCGDVLSAAAGLIMLKKR